MPPRKGGIPTRWLTRTLGRTRSLARRVGPRRAEPSVALPGVLEVLVTVAIVSPARSRGRRPGQSPQEIAAVGSPDEALGHDRIALVVDLETSAVHEPRPGALDDPALRECLEAARVDTLDHLDAHVVAPTVLDEGAFEARVTPEFGEASRAVAGPVGHVDPLSGVKPLGFLAHNRRRPYRASVNDASRGLALATFSLTHRRGQPLGDALPGAAARPLEVVAVHRVPVRIALGQRPPLTARGGHVEDGVHDATSIDRDGTTHRTGCPIRRDQIGDEVPLLVAHVSMRRSPGLRYSDGVSFHDKGYAATNPRWGLSRH